MTADVETRTPLIVDLEGSLVRCDLESEAALLAVRTDWSRLWSILRWLATGNFRIKRQLARLSRIDASGLPYRREVLELLEAEKAQGRRLVLVTGGSRNTAEAVADHLGLFDAVLVAEPSSTTKADKLQAIEQFCRGCDASDFAYLGNARTDSAVWDRARERISVSAAEPVGAASAERAGLRRIVDPPKHPLRNVVRLIRPHQWSKNVLIFLPPLMKHDFSLLVWMAATIAFAAFCCCASGVYVVNDLLDLPADRRHPKKRRRPFAAGDLPLSWGPPLALALFGGAFACALLVSVEFVAVLLLYFAVTTLYSAWLKGMVIVDVLLLAGLYSLRVFAGGIATDITVSEWLTAFCFFFFTSLAFAKRYAELSRIARDEGSGSARGYVTGDLQLLETLGPTSGYLSVLVLALYIKSPDMADYYHRAGPLWLLCPVLMYWITRLWLHAKRGTLHEDPTIYLYQDRGSRMTLAASALLWLAAFL